MMTEIYWKAFIGGVIEAVVAKILGCKCNAVMIFTVAMVALIAVMILLIFISDTINDWRKKRKEKK